ncbi:MAG: ABC transporter substrate-binding protein [Elusimicrobia bacterium]|nr:ABC transporter substrate-binding protein [Elusimicrobiota bacterium]
MRASLPRRVVCLTEESVETLYLLGREDLVVGVSGYARRPPAARLKPRVCAYVTADIPKILALEPDLVLGFSDLQAGIAKDLISAGLDVAVFNQRSLSEILGVVRMTGALVGAATAAEKLAARLAAGVERAARRSRRLPARPKVYFEEWDAPLISGIRWVEELVEAAGGKPVFPELRGKGLAKERVVEPAEVARRDPDLILASWCGKKADLAAISRRPGWEAVSAVRRGLLREVPSTIILQPGPAALTDGLAALERHVAEAARVLSQAASKTKRV